LQEMERGLDQLGMLGVSMTCSCFDRSTAEAEFEPLYAEMNRRRAVLNYHPIQNGICSPMINDYKFTVSVGASLEDAAIVLHLIARRMPERYPNITYVIPHLGGLIPMQLQRLDNQVPRNYPDLPERPSVTARRFYYDTVGHGSHAARPSFRRLLPDRGEDPSASLDGFGVDEDNREHAGLRPAIDPVVDRAPLHHDVAGRQVDGRVVQLHVDLAGHDDDVIDRVRAV